MAFNAAQLLIAPFQNFGVWLTQCLCLEWDTFSFPILLTVILMTLPSVSSKQGCTSKSFLSRAWSQSALSGTEDSARDFPFLAAVPL